jgi:hypothetical protein
VRVDPIAARQPLEPLVAVDAPGPIEPSTPKPASMPVIASTPPIPPAAAPMQALLDVEPSTDQLTLF